MQRLAEDAEDAVGVSVYRDPKQMAVTQPGEIPAQLVEFARDALQDALKDPAALGRALGEYMTEPKANVWFDATEPIIHPADQALAGQGGQIQLDRRTKMMFDAKHIFINGAISVRRTWAVSVLRPGVCCKIGRKRGGCMNAETPGPLPSGRFSGRIDFAQGVRDALACAAREGWPEIVLSDATFEDWPLRERSVVESLQAWSKAGRHMTLLATRFDEVVRQQPRFVAWRQTWGQKRYC